MAPMQPLYRDQRGTVRFKANSIIKLLFDRGLLDLNAIARLDFPAEDRRQIAQLLGYSVDGYMDLSFVTDEPDSDEHLEQIAEAAGEFASREARDRRQGRQGS